MVDDVGEALVLWMNHELFDEDFLAVLVSALGADAVEQEIQIEKTMRPLSPEEKLTLKKTRFDNEFKVKMKAYNIMKKIMIMPECRDDDKHEVLGEVCKELRKARAQSSGCSTGQAEAPAP